MTQGTWYSGRSSMLSSDSWLIDIGEGSHPNPMHRSSLFQRDFQISPKPVIGSGGLSSSQFDDDAPDQMCQLHMNSVVFVESQGSCALVRIVRLQKFDRRDMIFTVHLNRLPRTHHWSSPRSKLSYKKPTSSRSSRKLRKFLVTIGSRFEAS